MWLFEKVAGEVKWQPIEDSLSRGARPRAVQNAAFSTFLLVKRLESALYITVEMLSSCWVVNPHQNS